MLAKVEISPSSSSRNVADTVVRRIEIGGRCAKTAWKINVVQSQMSLKRGKLTHGGGDGLDAHLGPPKDNASVKAIPYIRLCQKVHTMRLRVVFTYWHEALQMAVRWLRLLLSQPFSNASKLVNIPCLDSGKRPPLLRLV
jgi:hypothetical protein